MNSSQGEIDTENLNIYLNLIDGVGEDDLKDVVSRMLGKLEETRNPEFLGIKTKVKMTTGKPDASTFLAIGFPQKLDDQAKDLNQPLPVIVLSENPVVKHSEQKILLSPRLSVETMIRWDRLKGDSPDPEETSLLLNSLKRRIRKTLRNNRTEESLSKKITWKIDIGKDSAQAGFMSFFGDSSTRNMVEDLKSAVLSMEKRWACSKEQEKRWANLQREKNGDGFNLRDLASQLETTTEGKRTRPPSILLLGETGTGKTLLARYISEQLAPGEDLHQLNIGAISHDFMYGELFGGTVGAWTDLKADSLGFMLSNVGKPVFLDEIGDMEERCQVQLLTLLDKGEVKPLNWHETPIPCPILIIAASNRPLKAWAAEGSERFRSDLFHRFDHVIEVPSLRERKADLRLLISTTLQDPEVNPKGDSGFAVGRISLDAIAYLERLEFPGNFRELRYILSRAVAEASREGSGTICLRHLARLA